MDDREARKRRLGLYETHPHYEFVEKVVRERVSIELEEMSEHPSLSGDMQWALAYAAKMVLKQK